MKFGILHLSDIHLSEKNAHICDRAERIVAAARARLADCDHVAVIVTGDVAFSGKAGQYSRGKELLTAVCSELARQIPSAQTSLAIAPGNHDCDFDTAKAEARKIVVDAARRDPTKARDGGIVEICTAVQDAFFAFRDDVAKPDTEQSRLVCEYVICIGERKVRIRCLNTAWMSQKDEMQGSLTFPSLSPASAGTDSALVITAMHHPYNWFEATNSRLLRREIEARSDLIFTGHEHEAGAHRKISHTTSLINEFIEGAVLQDSDDATHSGFNVVVVDVHSARFCVETFAWNGTLYVSASHDESPLRLNGGLRRQDFAFAEAFERFLNDPGISLTHRGKATVTLDDIFVWPNVRAISYGRQTAPRQFSAEKLLEVIKSEKLVLLSGAERSGKTTLCKQLMKAFRQDGLIPVLLSSSRSSSVSAATVDTIVGRTFQEQYGRDDLDRYIQLTSDRKVLILDDIERSGLPRPEKLRLLKRAASIADYVVVTTSDLTHDLEGIVYSKSAREAEIDFHPYRVQEFGHYLRNAIIERWFAIGADRLEVSDRLSRDWAQVRRTIDTVVGKNFVPSYPVFILSILQAFEAARPVDTSASTYGYFYEVLVREALQITKGDPETTNEYLARLARFMFDRRIQSVSEKELRSFHADYEREMDLTVPFARLVSNLERGRILEADGDDYRFCYRYIYYYFVATHLRDRIAEDVTRSVVSDMAAHLHVEEYAHIMLFLAHVCRDPFIIDIMLLRARRIYSDAIPARLEDDISFANESTTDFELKYVDGDITISRRRLLSDLDDLEQEVPEFDDIAESAACRDSEFEELDQILQLNVALKTIQILGQILRNFAGSIVGDMKVVIAEECYLLGLRTLGAVLRVVRENEESVVAMMFNIMRKEYPSAKDEMVFERAKGAVYWFTQIISYGMVKKVAYAVGSERLAQTYRRVKQRHASVAVSLIDMSLKLDHIGLPPEHEILSLRRRLSDNALASSLLSQLVIHHFYMFDVHYETKQSLCGKLKIPFETIQTADRRQKLVVAPAFKTPKLLLATSARPAGPAEP